jgi:hypothetical protein
LPEILKKNEAIPRIMAFIRPPFQEWYVGITSKTYDIIFQDHKVPLKSKSHTFVACPSASVARGVEKFFLEELKTSGGPSDGDEASVFVYAFKKTQETEPPL